MTSVIHKATSEMQSQTHEAPVSQGFFTSIRAAAGVFLALTVMTGVAYPLLVTLTAQTFFPWQAGGSLIDRQGKPTRDTVHAAGSNLIGQNFADATYFWPRPSATSPVPYTAFNSDKGTGSSGSNLSPAGQAFADAVQARVAALHAADPDNHDPIPIDLVTASGSGLDPHESIAAARYQAPRVARVRGVPIEKINQLIDQNTLGRSLGVLGEPVVHVLKLNLALDSAYPIQSSK